MNLNQISRFYFIGIGGIGMSALARFFKFKGFEVAGYDKTPSPLTATLIEEGIAVHYEDLGSNIPAEYQDTESTLVVYTPAIPKDMGELVFVQKNHQVLKRSEVLGLLTQTSKGLGVAGTHGKTTTSTMLAYVMSQSSTPCSAFLGGISSNFNTNVLVNGDAEYVVIEADEFDRSFLRLNPYASIITAVDPDHLDIYGDEESFIEGFQAYADKHTKGGLVVHKNGIRINNSGFKAITYGINDASAQVRGVNLRYDFGKFLMDVKSTDLYWKDVELGLPGIHNAENALAVCALCLELGLSENEIRSGLASFKGVKRRFEYRVKREDRVYIDDYAHHPTEINALIASVRLLYPGKRVAGIFQPHLFTRTRDFLSGFIAELSKLDDVILMPIYPARELPIPGVDSNLIVEAIGEKAQLMDPELILKWAESTNAEIVLTIGAGDIDRLVGPLTEIFTNS